MKVCIPFKGNYIGGTSTFANKLKTSLESKGILVTQEPEEGTQVVLITGSASIRKIKGWKKKGIKIVQRLDGVYYFRIKSFLYPIFNFRMRQIQQKWADYIIYQSEYSKKIAERFLGITATPHGIIYNGVDLKKFSPEGGKISFKKNSKDKILFTAGQFRRQEMLVPLLQAVSLLSKDRDDFKFIVAGPINPGLNNAISMYRNKGWIEFYGSISHAHLPDYERGSDVFLFSDASASPNSVIEALSCGLPVVAFDRGGVSELIDESCGALVKHSKNEYRKIKPFDIQNFCKSIEHIFNDLETKKIAAREKAKKRFNLENMAEEYIEVFKRIQ